MRDRDQVELFADLTLEETAFINGGGRIWRKIKRRFSRWANSIGGYFADLFTGSVTNPWSAPDRSGQRDYPEEP